MKYVRRSICALWRAVLFFTCIAIGVSMGLSAIYIPYYFYDINKTISAATTLTILFIIIVVGYFFNECKDKWGDK